MDFFGTTGGIVFGALMIVGAIAAITYAVWSLFGQGRSADERLREMGGGAARGRVSDPIRDKVMERIASLAATKDEEQANRQRLRLVQAGYRAKNAAEVFTTIRVVGSIGLPLLILPFGGSFSLVSLAALVLVLAAAGYYLPQVVLSNHIVKRQKRLMMPFPDALDLLVSSVEAGFGLDAAFRRVAEEMEAASPELAREFQLVNNEISAGLGRIDALRHLEQRTGLPAVKSLVNMLTQSERFGTSIARSLRIHSHIAREKRMSAAEEEAAKVSPKLTVVMILFLLPCLMVVLLGPAMVNIKNNFMDK